MCVCEDKGVCIFMRICNIIRTDNVGPKIGMDPTLAGSFGAQMLAGSFGGIKVLH